MFVQKMFTREGILALCAMLAFGAPAFAAEEEEEEVVTTGDVMVTSTRVEKELHNVPMSVSVISAEQVEKSSANIIGELLRDVPGVQLSSSGTPGMKRVMIRGEDTTRTVILIDGQKLSEHKSMDGVPLLIDPSRVERIEVIKGPASVLYGSDAIGGVVNIITKKGGEKPIQGQLSVGYDGSTNGFTESLSVFGNIDGFKYRLTGSNTNNENLDTPYGEMPNTKYKQKEGSAFLSYDFCDHFTAGITLDYFDGDYNATSISYYDDPDYDFFVKMPTWTREKYAFFAEAKELTDFFSRARLDVWYQKTHKEMENYVGADSDGTEMVVDNFADNYLRTIGASLQTDWQLGDNNYLIVGYEMTYDRLDADGVSYFNMNYPMTTSMSVQINKETDKFYQASQLTQAVFANMETQLPADFAVTYGLRYTHVKSELDRADEYYPTYNGGMYMGSYKMMSMFDYGGTSSLSDDGSNSHSRPVFNVGVVWTGIENLALRASWAQGFRVPILQEMYVDTSMGSSSGAYTRANPDLDPETSDNFEIGARYSNAGLNLDWSAFYSAADDYITTVPMDDGSDDYIYTNVAKAKTWGSELAVSYDLPCGFTPYVTATWLRRQYDDGEGYKTFNTATPKLSGRYGVRYRHALTENVDFNADVFFRSQSATKYTSSSGDSDYRIGGFTTANIAFGFEFGDEKQYNVQAEILNLFDKQYQYITALYEPGIHCNLKVSVKF